MVRRLVPMALALALFACATTYPPSEEPGPPLPRDEYPAGPYGNKVGDIIENLAFGNPDGSPFTLDDDVFKDEHNRVLFIATSAGWCGVCLEHQNTYQAMYQKYKQKGLAMLSVVFEDKDNNPADGRYVADWQKSFQLTFPVLTQESFYTDGLGKYYDTALTPLSMVIDVDTMKILYIATGFQEDAVTAIIEANLPN